MVRQKWEGPEVKEAEGNREHVLRRKSFRFLKPGVLISADLELALVSKKAGNHRRDTVPGYVFEMRLAGTRRRIGQIDLRIGNTERIVMYGGHVGYNVDEEHRGHRYAARSIPLLFPLAKSHGLSTLWITCNPDNIASRRTCEIAGGEFVEIVDLPKDSNLYQAGERQKCRYRFDI